MSLPILPAVVASMLWNLAPTAQYSGDAHGWAVRTRGHVLGGPYLVGEEPDWHQFEILLFNKSPAARTYPTLHDAWRYGELTVEMTRGKDEVVPRNFRPVVPNPGDVPAQLKAGERDSKKFTLRDFGFWQFREPGEYRAQVEFSTPQGKTVSPPWKFTVVDIPEMDIVATQVVQLVGFRAKRPPNEQARITVQQVKVGDRMFLIYRIFASAKNGGGVSSAVRLAELPGKADMTIEGEYGDERSPITVKYKDKNAPTGTTTLVIDSINGRPWKADKLPR